MRSLISLLAAGCWRLPRRFPISRCSRRRRGRGRRSWGRSGCKARTASPDTRVFVLPAGTAGSAGMGEPGGERRHPGGGGGVLDGGAVRVPPREGEHSCGQHHGRARPAAADRVGAGRRNAALCGAAGGAGLRARALDRRAHAGGAAARRRRGAVGGAAARRARVRAVSVPAAGAGGPGPGAAVPRGAACGRSSITPTGCAWTWSTSRSAGGRPASRRCTWPPGTSSSPTPSATLPAQPDRGLPPARNPGLCVAGAAARQREVLERSSRNGARRPRCSRTRTWTGASS